MKRGVDHVWELSRYAGDIMIYAECQCGFRYGCSHSKRREDGTWSIEQEVTNLYNYCPNCGARKKYRTEDIEQKEFYVWENELH